MIGRGKAKIVEDEQEKIHGLKLLMENQTKRTFEMNGNDGGNHHSDKSNSR